MQHTPRLLLALFLPLFLLEACNRNPDRFTLRVDIPSLGSDTVLVYGNNEFFDHIDTLRAEGGQLHFSFDPDTVTPMWMLFPNGYSEFFFAEKGAEATLSGDTACPGHLTLAGGTQNDLLASFRQAVSADSTLTLQQQQHMADTFIAAHPFDEVSVYLLQKYYVDIPKPEAAFIRSGIGKMSGNLQDNSYVNELRTRLNAVTSRNTFITLSSCHLKDTLGRRVNSAVYTDSCVLVTVWASWDEESRQRQREYRDLVKEFKKRKFAVVSVSLDTNRDAWMKALKEDSLECLHTCNLEGWGQDIVRVLGITDLPANALLDKQRHVRKANIYGQELHDEIKALFKVDEEAEKAEKAKLKGKRKRK